MGMEDFDVVIIGAGIAGASLAAELSGHLSVLILEAETQAGYHATGRSVAFWTESYGGPGVQPLTSASGAFLARPPADMGSHPFMKKRGALHIGQSSDLDAAKQMLQDYRGSGIEFEPLELPGIQDHLPMVKLSWFHGLWEPECCDIDVAALHQAYLAKAKRLGCALRCNAKASKIAYHQNRWRIESTAGSFTAKTLVNAAGAWADDIAQMAAVKPIGISPYRRTVVQLSMMLPVAHDMPLVMGLDESFYFKPGSGGTIWLSPHDETFSPPCDAAAEEWDVASAVDRFQAVTDMEIKYIDHKWAGLRSFASDRLPVIGRDSDVPDFYWLAGQGGFGIQTSPAIAQIAAAQILETGEIPALVNPKLYSPSRFN
jgi:D-arginine dehydrogenase